MAIDPAKQYEVSGALREYLAAHLGQDVAFSNPPAPIGRGFDTHIYGFRLNSDGIDAAWAKPLVLRLYTTPGQADKASSEGATQRFAAQRGYPALDPLAVERCAPMLGLPLMIMERVDGVPMLEKIGANPMAVRRQFAAMAEAHVALHTLPIDACPLPADGPLVERELAECHERVGRLSAQEDSLASALTWLETHKSQVMREELSLCHGDFHPLNIMVDDGGNLAVLDWSDAVLGDRHFDVARTLALFQFAWIAGRSSFERLVLRLARGFLAWSYFEPYRRALSVDMDRLRYWQAFHAAQAWLQLAELADPGNQNMSGAREDSVARLPEGLLPHVKGYFYERAGHFGS